MRRLLSGLLAFTMTFGMLSAVNTYSVKGEERSLYDLEAEDVIDLDNLYGWADVAGEGVYTTTGGGNSSPIVVSDKDFLQAVAWGSDPTVIIIDGVIDLRGYLYVGSNKTIVGADENAGVIGDIVIDEQNNVIISNLNVEGGWPATRPEDCITIRNSHHVWVDHVNAWDGADGNLDITESSDYITVSWCKFWYTDSSHDHRKSNLIGSGTGHDYEDMGKLNVTYHHCWFGDKLNVRQPRLLYGKGHIYNNYYTSTESEYCIGVGSYAAGLIENNYFDGVNNPHQFYAPGTLPASMVVRGNEYNNCVGDRHSGYVYGMTSIRVPDFDNPPYEYYLDDAKDVPALVMEYAGPQNILEDGLFKSEQPVITPAPDEEIPYFHRDIEIVCATDNPITYDKESDTYTYHGQNLDGTNGELIVKNPFAGMDLSETPTYNSDKYPQWKNGVTLSYWVYLPDYTFDAPIINFNLRNDRQMSAEDSRDYELCQGYSAVKTGYSLGEVSTYYSVTGEPMTVLKGNGRNSEYNPDYPAEGAYSRSNTGTILAYPEGVDPKEHPYAYELVKFLGEGKYDTHSAKFDEEGGENSMIEEALVDGSLSLYASATVGYMRDNKLGQSINPNVDSYGKGTAVDYGNEYQYWGNGGINTNWEGILTPTMEEKEKWHFVVSVIQNDGITTYIDGIKMGYDYLNYFGYDLPAAIEKEYYNYNFAKGFAFNWGYGPKLSYRTNTPDALYKYARTMLDMVTDEDTVLSIGGLGCAAFAFAQDYIPTDEGVQVKNVKAYPAVIEPECIYSDRVVSYYNGYAICGDELVELAPDATPTPVPTVRPTEVPTDSPVPTAIATEIPTETPIAFEPGDVNMDGNINAVDALLILKHAAKIEELEGVQLYLADVNEDTSLDARDALEVLKIAAKLK